MSFSLKIENHSFYILSVHNPNFFFHGGGDTNNKSHSFRKVRNDGRIDKK